MRFKTIFYNQFQNNWIEFKDPIKVYKAYSLDEIPAILKSVDEHMKETVYIAGFLSYEAASAFDVAIKTKKVTSFPLGWFGIFKDIINFTPAQYSLKLYKSEEWISSVSKRDYIRNIRKIKEYIAGGYTYQVNYTYRLISKFHGDMLSFFLSMIERERNGYFAYIDIEDFVICSASPELFFRLDGSSIISKPMKGTAERGKYIEEDLVNADKLYRSEKDRAENTMIVDMIRNDLGRISEAGSVRVDSLYDIETYQTVLQMTSSVSTKTNAALSDIFRSMFPCASVTGAPKYKTTEIITELESTPRKIYTGTIGFVLPQRKAQFNVAIRTALIDRKLSLAEYGVGGGIIWDSDEKKEFEESRSKMKILTQTAPQFDIVETILWQPADGYFLFDYHLRRMTKSAEYFNFSFDSHQIEQSLADISLNFFDKPCRVRLSLSRDGSHKCTAEILEDDTQINPLKLTFSKLRIDSNDPFLYHKTTYRTLYERAIERHKGFDDLIFVNEHEEITETSIYNIVVKLEGQLVTPPVRCGLLPGTLRAWLLDNKKIQERIIYRKEFKNCKEIFLINSVRGWKKAILAQ